jgi:hypothetical protein
MAAARQVFRVGCTEADGYRVTVALVYDIKLSESQRFHPSAPQKDRRESIARRRSPPQEQ